MKDKALILRLLLTGGGTGGHIYPLVSVTKKIKQFCDEKGVTLDVRYFGDPGVFSIYLENSGVKVVKVMSSKLRRYFSFLNFLDFFKFFFGIIAAIWKLFWFMPDVVFSKGGPGALAIIYAARFYRIPVVIHESDAAAGLTNKQSAKHSVAVEVAFEQAVKDFNVSVPVNVVGGLVRDDLFLDESPVTSRFSLGLSNEKPVILILGGSQGAQKINEMFLENSESILKEFEVVHQVGRANYLDYKSEYEFISKNHPIDIKKNYRIFPYLDDKQLAAAYNAADIVVCRSGSSVFELAALGKPAILVPLPTSANNHQRENAYAYAESGAAIVMEEENFLPSIFISQVKKLVSQPEHLERMKQAARTFYKADAADRVASDVIDASRIVTYYSNQLSGEGAEEPEHLRMGL